ncbi:hypothetical protein C1645_828179 [Glomus cerebriforme]|uniref:Uncharacterized protein n=1 Tax=Glomus cerebriforme TaxID=658196 RepID=A0A397SQH2_9GLOM|nr:hypothetical protein C1645_828179 [Glomus cerebriforme]
MASYLPDEIIQEIISILYEPYIKSSNILYNCMLLNKNWCINTMAVTWRKVLDDYTGSDHNKEKIINTYIAELSRITTYCSYYNYASFLREIELLNLHAVGKKRLSIETFPENVFVYLFKDEETFKYSPAKHQYQCYFEGFAGATRLKQIFRYDQWDFRQHPLTNTKGYVLLEDYENKYQVKFIWSQSTLSENNREFILGRMSCNFVADSGEFQEK